MPKKKPDPPFTARLPSEVVAALTRHAGNRGGPRNVLVVEALRTYVALLDAGLRVYVEPGQVRTVEGR